MPPAPRAVPTTRLLHALPCLGLSLLGATLTLAGQPAPVEVTRAVRGETLSQPVSLTGSVNALRRSRLSARTSGLVGQVEVDAGSRVAEGDVLLRLDPRLAEITLESVRAEVARAEVELEDATRQAQEVRSLSQAGGLARTEADSRLAAVKIQTATLEQLRAREREQVEIIARHQLLAPFAGVISKRMTEVGEWVQTGTPVLELVGTERLRFDIQVPQESLAAVQGGGEASVRLDAYPHQVFPAKLDVSVPVKDPVSRTSLARLTMEDPEGLAFPGMSGTATLIPHTEGDTAIRIHRDTIVRSPDGTTKVWIVEPDGEASIVRSQEVQIEASLGQQVAVLGGLQGGETLVLKGNEALEENQRVTIIADVSPPETATDTGTPPLR